jgi:hypothetical protein
MIIVECIDDKGRHGCGSDNTLILHRKDLSRAIKHLMNNHEGASFVNNAVARGIKTLKFYRCTDNVQFMKDTYRNNLLTVIDISNTPSLIKEVL